jgi:hypothetical protein
VIHATCVELRGTAFNAVDLVAFLEQ